MYSTFKNQMLQQDINAVYPNELLNRSSMLKKILDKVNGTR